jgi:hypothetical protein
VGVARCGGLRAAHGVYERGQPSPGTRSVTRG